MTDRLAALRVPPHVGVMLGVSTAAYAVALAGVTGLQAAGDAELAADRAPAIAAIEDVSARNQALADALQQAGSRYDEVAQAYAAAGGRLSDLEAALTDLATSVQRIDGVSRSLPTSVSLPRVSRQVSSGGGAPATSSTTGASGG
jgi:hypothetical protein